MSQPHQERGSDPASADWRDRYRHALTGLATPKRVLVRGEGMYVWDVDGNRYLDFLAGIAVNALGHAHPVLVDAVSSQVGRLAHISNYYASPSQIGLAEKLQQVTGAGAAGRVYFGNSGTEANEAALKFARLHKPGGRVLALEGSFHGRTFGGLSLTGQPAMREPFQPVVPNIGHVARTVAALAEALDDEVAAVFVEPILGEAGVVDLPDGYLAEARRLTARHGALLVLDEVQTGVARTGDWYAFHRDGIMPDIVTTAKGLAGGVPIGATVAFGATASLFTPGRHGTTFGGNPLATTAALAVLGEIERAGLLANARAMGERFRAGVEALGSPLVTDLSGRGLLIGIGLATPVADAVVAKALDAGLIVNAAGSSRLRIAPPLIVGAEHVDEAVALLGGAFAAVLEAGAVAP